MGQRHYRIVSSFGFRGAPVPDRPNRIAPQGRRLVAMENPLQFFGLLLSMFTFGLAVACVFICISIQSAVRRSNSQVSLFKGQFSYLNERLDELREKVDKAEKSGTKALEDANHDLAERIKSARQETLRENDDLKFLLQQIRGPKKAMNAD